MPTPTHFRHPWSLLLGIALLAGTLACSDPAPERTAVGGVGPAGEALAADSARGGRTYQRSVVFIDLSSDTTMFVPWEFENRSEPGGVARSIRGWLGRGGQWALFMEDDWVTSPSRAPWRILPRGPARILMESDDALQSIFYQEGLRDLGVDIGPLLVEWRGQRGEIYRLSEGSARLSETTTDGLILDVSTARLTGEVEPAEWGLLVGEDGSRLLLADPEGPGEYRAWLRGGEQDLTWPEVTVEWAETRSFERARREIPVLWRFRSADGQLTGEFESVSSHFKALDGEGAILPALGVYEVRGTVTVDGNETEVGGFLRHFQS
ncbi:MAG: hypothetical protein ACR2QM_10590 [Longimicrobiales bacterium]